MAFRPKIHSTIQLGNTSYVFMEHPSARGIPYGQAGSRATVYQVRDMSGRFYALKVFLHKYRDDENIYSATRLQKFANISGLEVCSRIVLNKDNHAVLIKQYPDLEYAILMPWVDGRTWYDTVFTRDELPKDESLSFAKTFASLLSSMEEKGLAHCDLSGPNVIVSTSGQSSTVALVDVEEMFGPGLKKPAYLPSGTAGYAHHAVSDGLWGANADRFSGAVLLAEMLAWFDQRTRNMAAKEHFFKAEELQKDNNKFRLICSVLHENWGSNVENLFRQAWISHSLAECPSFSEWKSALYAIGAEGQDVVSVLPYELDVDHGAPPESKAPAPSPVMGFRGGLLKKTENTSEPEPFEENVVLGLDAYQQAIGNLGKSHAVDREMVETPSGEKTEQPIAPPPTVVLSNTATQSASHEHVAAQPNDRIAKSTEHESPKGETELPPSAPPPPAAVASNNFTQPYPTKPIQPSGPTQNYNNAVNPAQYDHPAKTSNLGWMVGAASVLIAIFVIGAFVFFSFVRGAASTDISEQRYSTPEYSELSSTEAAKTASAQLTQAASGQETNNQQPTSIPTKKSSSTSPAQSASSSTTKIVFESTVSTIYLRSGPDQWAPIIAAYSKGSQFEALERHNSWYYVLAPNGKKGWVYKDWVDDEKYSVDFLPEAKNVPTPYPSPIPTAVPKNNKYP